eukprot:304016_1
MEFSFSPKRLVVAVAAALPLMASAADTPSTATARKGFAGYDHPNQYLVKPATTIADNMMPVMQHPAQDKETQQKLAELEKKTGKKPNVVVFLLDDVGWMDVGFNGGGVAVGNPTPDIDAVASQGLILTSAYSQPSSSPTRATILTGQYSIHHGILMPPMYGQPGGLQGLTTLPQLLHDQGYVTQAIGKWHMGENKESQPQNVGFDDFRGMPRRSRRSPRHLRVSGQRRRRYRDERYPTQSPMPLTVACASPELERRLAKVKPDLLIARQGVKLKFDDFQ